MAMRDIDIVVHCAALKQVPHQNTIPWSVSKQIFMG